MRNKKGFTMVELLVVLVIVAILAAVATPIYLANVQRARASEAVSSMALIRQGQRDYQISGGNYFDIAQVATGTITNALPLSVNTTTNVATPPTAGVNIQDGVAQYFGNTAFTVDASLAANFRGASTLFQNPDAVDFVITVQGHDVDLAAATALNGENEQCVGAAVTNCATKAVEVDTYLLEMDNTGRTFVCYDWQAGVGCGGAANDQWQSY